MRIHREGAVRAFIRRTMRRIGVFRAGLAISGVAVDHGIHISGSHTEIQIRPSQRAEWLCGLPVGLADDPHSEALCLQQTPNQCHAKTGMIDISVARDQDDVACIPAQLLHFPP